MQRDGIYKARIHKFQVSRSYYDACICLKGKDTPTTFISTKNENPVKKKLVNMER